MEVVIIINKEVGMMKIILSSFVVNGVKNIKKPVRLDFMNYKNDIKEGAKYSNVKSFKQITALYGSNGAGKSAIIHGFEIMLNFIRKRNFLHDKETQNYLNALMNLSINQMEIAMEFFLLDEQNIKPQKYEYTIILNRNLHLGTIDVTQEKFLSLKPKKETIFLIEGGDLKDGIIPDFIIERVWGRTVNRSFFDVLFYDLFLDSLSSKEKEDVRKLLIPIGSVVINSSFHFTESDTQDEYQIIGIWAKSLKIINQYDVHIEIKPGEFGIKIVDEENYAKYCQEIKKLTRFMQLFKSDLENISITQRKVNDTYHVALLFNYNGNYSVDFAMESTGTKKLCNLFFVLHRRVKEGRVLFIDELDSSINDVYLLKLIEYFVDYAKGQIIFTTHNTSPMEIMNNRYRKDKCQICFLSPECILTTWKQVGSFNPANLYKKGQIKGLPFYMDAPDFIDIFKE